MKLQDAVKPFIGSIVGRVVLESQAEALAVFVASALTLARSILTDLAVEMKRQAFSKTTKAALKRLDRWINNPRGEGWCGHEADHRGLDPQAQEEADRQLRLGGHLLLILAIAYLILCGLGLLALRLREPREWCPHRRTGEAASPDGDGA
jgi:hypothetical protein